MNNVQTFLGLVVAIMVILGSTIPLYIVTDNKIEAMRLEMVEFHAFLERQDIQFKNFMMYQDQRPE